MRHFVHHIRHLSRRRRNRVLATFLLINLLLAFLLYSNIVTYPNTYLGTVNISGKTAGQVTSLIKTEQKILPKIQVKNRTYEYRYDQLGIVVDSEQTVNDAFAPNRAMFPLNLVNFFQSLVTKRLVQTPLEFTQKFDQFVDDQVFDVSTAADAVSVDPETKSLVVEENSGQYRFDRDSLKELLHTHFGSYTRPIYPMLAKKSNETIKQIADVNQKLSAVFGTPIMVYLDMGGSTQAIELKEEDIRAATTVSYDPSSINASLSVNAKALNDVLTKRIHGSGFPIRDSLVTQNVIADFTKVIALRLQGVDISAVSTAPGAGPTTNGSLANKYIEVDIAQAKMYLFTGGKMLKSYPVSTGLDYPTPTGKFEILNKVGLGFSDIYNDWLPWWMGFSYSRELNAYFGIHEQPYRIAADGKFIQASPQSIGTPSTGGCVALAPGAAREVYTFADVGTPVYIYN